MKKIAHNMIEDLQVLAHHAKTTGKNLEFTAEQIQEIRRVIIDLMLPEPLSAVEIEALAFKYLENAGQGITGVYDFVRAIEERHGIK